MLKIDIAYFFAISYNLKLGKRRLDRLDFILINGILLVTGCNLSETTMT